MEGKFITDKEQQTLMFELGFTFDDETGKYFLGDNAYLGSVEGNIHSIDELIAADIERNPAHLSSFAAEMMNRGAELSLGQGGIDDHGQRLEKGLYCSNYKDLLFQKKH